MGGLVRGSGAEATLPPAAKEASPGIVPVGLPGQNRPLRRERRRSRGLTLGPQDPRCFASWRGPSRSLVGGARHAVPAVPHRSAPHGAGREQSSCQPRTVVARGPTGRQRRCSPRCPCSLRAHGHGGSSVLEEARRGRSQGSYCRGASSLSLAPLVPRANQIKLIKKKIKRREDNLHHPQYFAASPEGSCGPILPSVRQWEGCSAAVRSPPRWPAPPVSLTYLWCYFGSWG